MAADLTPKQQPRKKDNVIRLVVTSDAKESIQPALWFFNQDKMLPEIVYELCDKFQIRDPENYAIKWEDTGMYVTEKNRSQLKDAAVLCVTLSPASKVTKMMQQIQKGSTSGSSSDRVDALRTMKTDAKDKTYATHLVKQNGHEVLMRLVADSRANSEPTSMKWALGALSELLIHDIVPLADVPDSFIKIIVTLISTHSYKSDPEPTSPVCSALRIAKMLVRSHPNGYTFLRAVNIQSLINHIDSPHPVFRERGLGLVNALLAVSPSLTDRETLFQSLESNSIGSSLTFVVREESVPVADLAHELYLFQYFYFNRLQLRLQQSLTKADRDNLIALPRLLPQFQEDAIGRVDRPQQMATELDRMRRLGFSNPSAPEEDFRAPHALVALDVMAAFASEETAEFTNSVLGQLNRPEAYTFPFVRMSLAITELLLKLLHVGQAPSTTEESYMMMFFGNCAKAFRTLFAACVVIATKTWQAMDAMQADFDKVLLVLQKQLSTVLTLPPAQQPVSDDAFKTLVLNKFSYANILQADLDRFAQREKSMLKSEAVERVRRVMEDEARAVVRARQLRVLCDGDAFENPRRSKKKGDARLYLMLAPNHKSLHWEELAERASHVPIAKLTNSCLVTSIRMAYFGNDVPSFSSKQKGGELALAFLADGFEDPIEFVCSSPYQFAVWADGLRSLLEKPVEEEATLGEISRLVNLDLKLRLLELYDADLPTALPVPPPPPADLNFYYEVSSESIS
eukprot:m.209978 g.209978  ORF g.209978 m.209978 type:complete len:741 (-) comp15553_c0_seq18:126-2348(-)